MNFIKPARTVERVFIHCTASNDSSLSGNKLVHAVRDWHKARGFVDIGYHYLIDTKGIVLTGRSLERSPAAQVGNNAGTIAICLHGLEVKDFTDAQFAALKTLCRKINKVYDGMVTFHGHCEVSDKTCPVFDYKSVLNLDNKGYMQDA